MSVCPDSVRKVGVLHVFLFWLSWHWGFCLIKVQTVGSHATVKWTMMQELYNFPPLLMSLGKDRFVLKSIFYQVSHSDYSLHKWEIFCDIVWQVKDREDFSRNNKKKGRACYFLFRVKDSYISTIQGYFQGIFCLFRLMWFVDFYCGFPYNTWPLITRMNSPAILCLHC